MDFGSGVFFFGAAVQHWQHGFGHSEVSWPTWVGVLENERVFVFLALAGRRRVWVKAGAEIPSLLIGIGLALKIFYGQVLKWDHF
jgi:hypothetical protein